MQWKGKRVALIGLGISNLAVARFLTAQGAKVTACDQKNAQALGERYHELAHLGVHFQLGSDYLRNLDRYDVLFLTPGVPKHLPAFQRAQQAGVTFSSEMNLFFELCKAHIVGITGSSGKTTTTTLVGEILSAAGYPTYVGGNIGHPLVEVAERFDPNSWVVVELSSFQLELLHQSPEIALVTNITPNHLDVHPTMEAYIEAKTHIFSYQGKHDYVILNADNAATRAMAAQAPGKVAWFSRHGQVERGACLVNNRIMIAREGSIHEVCPVDEIRLMGDHNIENVLSAVAIADLVGCTAGAMRDVISSFTGVEHRLELVREAEGVAYYNDSKATTPAGAIAALRAFSRPVVLIAGGYDKRLPFDELAPVIVEKVKTVVLLGTTREQIAKAIADVATTNHPPDVHLADSLEEAVSIAKGAAVPGDVVLLSPACASWDMFVSFEERGNRFREIVRSLTEAEAPALP